MKLRDGQPVDRFSLTMKPRIFPRLHHHVAKVTGLTQAQLDAGVPIKEGLRRFARGAGRTPLWASGGRTTCPYSSRIWCSAGWTDLAL